VLPVERESHATSIGFKWGVCWSLTEVALDDLDPAFITAITGKLGAILDHELRSRSSKEPILKPLERLDRV
jgi:hypothetical protein